jgi:hypothetical protein
MPQHEQKSNFWLNPTFEPKRQFRFLVQVSLEGQDLTFLAKSVSRPSYSINENPHTFFNHTFYYPGRVTWETVDITLIDPVQPNGAELLYRYLSTIGAQKPTSFNAATSTTITKQSATEGLGRLVSQEISTPPGGGSTSIIEGEWELINAFPTSVGFGDHSYDSEEMVEISLTIRYDWAEYTKKRVPVDPSTEDPLVRG